MKKRVAVKIGSNVLALSGGGVDSCRIRHLVEQVATLHVPLVAEAKWGSSWYDAK